LVVVPSETFLATANAVRFVGAEVVFADVDPVTGLMEAENLLEAIKSTEAPHRIKATIPVHLNGQCADLQAISQLAMEHEIRLVEDASHAIGTRHLANQVMIPVGSCQLSDMTAFSFHPAKTIAMGEGGAVTTNDRPLAEKIRLLRNHGMIRDPDARSAPVSEGSRGPWYYAMQELGFNYRASDMHCALGLSQLGKLDRFSEQRRELVEHYDKILAPNAPDLVPVGRTANCEPVWHLYPVLVNFGGLGTNRAQFMADLRSNGVGTQVHFIPVHTQPYYRDRYGDITLPGAETYYSNVLTLPLFPGMTLADVDHVSVALARVLS
jgi:dTDP-4-amino-4,6-dideoxygalactose transaminase